MEVGEDDAVHTSDVLCRDLFLDKAEGSGVKQQSLSILFKENAGMEEFFDDHQEKDMSGNIKILCPGNSTIRCTEYFNFRKKLFGIWLPPSKSLTDFYSGANPSIQTPIIAATASWRGDLIL